MRPTALLLAVVLAAACDLDPELATEPQAALSYFPMGSRARPAAAPTS